MGPAVGVDDGDVHDRPRFLHRERRPSLRAVGPARQRKRGGVGGGRLRAGFCRVPRRVGPDRRPDREAPGAQHRAGPVRGHLRALRARAERSGPRRRPVRAGDRGGDDQPERAVAHGCRLHRVEEGEGDHRLRDRHGPGRSERPGRRGAADRRRCRRQRVEGDLLDQRADRCDRPGAGTEDRSRVPCRARQACRHLRDGTRHPCTHCARSSPDRGQWSGLAGLDVGLFRCLGRVCGLPRRAPAPVGGEGRHPVARSAPLQDRKSAIGSRHAARVLVQPGIVLSGPVLVPQRRPRARPPWTRAWCSRSLPPPTWWSR